MNMDDTIRKAIFHLRTAGEVTWNDFLPGAGDQYTLWYIILLLLWAYYSGKWGEEEE